MTCPSTYKSHRSTHDLMKCSTVAVFWVTLFAGVPTNQPRPKVVVPPRLVTIPVSQSQQASQTVVAFLNWYKIHLLPTSRILLVNQLPGKPYSVNLENGERYLAYLKSSHLLTDTYLGEWRTYFKERDAGFRLTRQDEGPPTGFEYDLVMLNQEVDKQMASLKLLKIDKVTIVRSRATVAFTLLGSYEFRLVKQNGLWMINEILNIGAE